MNALAEAILSDLRQVETERATRSSTPGLAIRVDAIKRYQQRRFAFSYAELLDSERYGPAARFFLEELYGPRDFADRDAQFAKVIPAMVRLFPRSVLDTVATLAKLHALVRAFRYGYGGCLADFGARCECLRECMAAMRRSAWAQPADRNDMRTRPLARSID